MQNINIKNTQEAANAYSAYERAAANQKYASAAGTMDAFEAVEQVQYDRTAKVETNAQTVMDNFEEYRRDMQEKAIRVMYRISYLPVRAQRLLVRTWICRLATTIFYTC